MLYYVLVDLYLKYKLEVGDYRIIANHSRKKISKVIGGVFRGKECCKEN